MFKESTRVIFLASMAMFLSMLDTGIMSLAVSPISAFFGDARGLGAHLLTSYSLLLCGSILWFGALASITSALFVFRWGSVVFLLTSLLCTQAWSLPSLIGFRGLQGLAAAMLQATAVALLSDYLPEKQRTKAIATVIACASAGPVLAPMLSGLMLEYLSWPWLFYINVPICLLLFLLSFKLAHLKACEVLFRFQNLAVYTTAILCFFVATCLEPSIELYSLAFVCLMGALWLDYQAKKEGVLLHVGVIDPSYYQALALFVGLGMASAVMFYGAGH
jgi:MFS family permease